MCARHSHYHDALIELTFEGIYTWRRNPRGKTVVLRQSVHGAVASQREQESQKPGRNQWIANTINAIQMDSTQKAGNSTIFLQERQHLRDGIQITVGTGLRNLRRLSAEARTSFLIEHFSRSSGELDRDDHSSTDGCEDSDYPEFSHQEWDGLAEGSCTIKSGRVDQEHDGTVPGENPEVEDAAAAGEEQAEMLAGVSKYGVPLYRLKWNLTQGVPNFVDTFYCTSCKHLKGKCVQPKPVKMRTERCKKEVREITTCSDCSQKRRDKYHAAKKRGRLMQERAQSRTVAPTQPLFQEVLEAAVSSVEGQAEELGLNKEFQILSAPRILNKGLKDMLHCTSRKKGKPVDLDRPGYLTCLACRQKKQMIYFAEKCESTAEVEKLGSQHTKPFWLNLDPEQGQDQSEQMQNCWKCASSTFRQC